ncbi:MAG: hypothetical protein ABR588_01850 [Sphingomicrobium sp.]
MRSGASTRRFVAVLAGLALVSVGVKGLVGPPRDGTGASRAGQVERQLTETLREQGFVVSLRPLQMQSSIVFGVRGECRLSVRDAGDGGAIVAIFAADAHAIGPVRYLYGSRRYGAPPTFAMRLARLESEAADRLGLAHRVPVPIALATSPQCPDKDFALDDIRVRI